MGNSQAGKVNQSINDERDRIAKQHGAAGDELQNQLGPAHRWADQQRNKVGQNYDSIWNSTSRYDQPISTAQNFASGNTITPTDRARMRGNGVFDEFSGPQGGWDANRRRDFMAQATATVPQFYENLSNSMSAGQRAQGGYNAGAYDAAMFKNARNAAAASQDAGRNASVDMNNAVDTNRFRGAEGAARSEGALQGQLSQNFGLGSGLAMQGRNAQDRLMENSAAGQEQLYGMDPGELNMLYKYLMENQGQRDQATGNNINTYAKYNPNRSFMDRLGPIIQGLGVGAAGLVGHWPVPGAATGFGGQIPGEGDYLPGSGSAPENWWMQPKFGPR